MTQTTSYGYPNAASTLALVGGVLIILSGVLLTGFSAWILPNVDYSGMRAPANVANLPGLVSGFIGTMGVLGLVSGIIVLASALMLQRNMESKSMWSALIIIFSVVSFLGLGGFFVGGILGVIGGILALTWKPQVRTGLA